VGKRLRCQPEPELPVHHPRRPARQRAHEIKKLSLLEI